MFDPIFGKLCTVFQITLNNCKRKSGKANDTNKQNLNFFRHFLKLPSMIEPQTFVFLRNLAQQRCICTYQDLFFQIYPD